MNSVTTANICRVCIGQNGFMRNLFSFDDDLIEFNIKLYSCVPSVRIDESDLPTAICEMCVMKLKQAYEFRQLCLSSTRALLSLRPVKRRKTSPSLQNVEMNAAESVTNFHISEENKVSHFSNAQNFHSTRSSPVNKCSSTQELKDAECTKTKESSSFKKVSFTRLNGDEFIVHVSDPTDPPPFLNPVKEFSDTSRVEDIRNNVTRRGRKRGVEKIAESSDFLNNGQNSRRTYLSPFSKLSVVQRIKAGDSSTVVKNIKRVGRKIGSLKENRKGTSHDIEQKEKSKIVKVKDGGHAAERKQSSPGDTAAIKDTIRNTVREILGKNTKRVTEKDFSEKESKRNSAEKGVEGKKITQRSKRLKSAEKSAVTDSGGVVVNAEERRKEELHTRNKEASTDECRKISAPVETRKGSEENLSVKCREKSQPEFRQSLTVGTQGESFAENLRVKNEEDLPTEIEENGENLHLLIEAGESPVTESEENLLVEIGENLNAENEENPDAECEEENGQISESGAQVTPSEPIQLQIKVKHPSELMEIREEILLEGPSKSEVITKILEDSVQVKTEPSEGFDLPEENADENPEENCSVDDFINENIVEYQTEYDNDHNYYKVEEKMIPEIPQMDEDSNILLGNIKKEPEEEPGPENNLLKIDESRDPLLINPDGKLTKKVTIIVKKTVKTPAKKPEVESNPDLSTVDKLTTLKLQRLGLNESQVSEDPKSEVNAEEDSDLNNPYICTMCDLGFKTTSGLKSHLRSHIVCKKVTCKKCGRIFPSRKDLVSHICTEKGWSTSKKCYKCPFCPKAFSSGSALFNHKFYKHVKAHVCSYCFRKFASVRSLRRHLTVHQRGVKDHSK